MANDYKAIEVAELCRVDVSTVLRWIRSGRLPAIRLPSGRIRIPAQEVERIRQPIKVGK